MVPKRSTDKPPAVRSSIAAGQAGGVTGDSVETDNKDLEMAGKDAGPTMNMRYGDYPADLRRDVGAGFIPARCYSVAVGRG